MMAKNKQKESKKEVGRPSKYNPELCQSLINFFEIEPTTTQTMTITTKKGDVIEKEEEVANNIPFFSKWCKEVGINPDTMNEWVKIHPEFSDAYKKAKVLQTEFIMVNGLRNNYNPAFAIFTLKNVSKWRDEDEKNWSDKTELTGRDEGPIEVKYNREEMLNTIAELIKMGGIKNDK